MSEERNLGVKAPGESKVEGPCRGTGGRGGGCFNFVKMKVLKLFCLIYV